MKNILLLILVVSAFNTARSQVIQSNPITNSAESSDETKLFQYIFAISDIVDGGSAKEITDILRPIFNNPETPFQYYPTFENGIFNFTSSKNIGQKELESNMLKIGHTVISFQQNKQ